MDFNDLIYRIYDKYRIFQVIFMDGIPFGELWPEYRQELICNLILELWAPEMSKTITMGDGLFLMICDPVKDMVTNRFIQLVP